MHRPSSLRLLALVFALALGPAAIARAEPLLAGLGGPAGYGTGNLPGNDDGSSSEIDITAAFPMGLRFFGTTFTTLYVNNNGNVSFGGPIGTFTPMAFPIASQRMIAAWWADVDTRNPSFPPPMHNGVYWSITPGRFVATWHNVGYYSEHDDRENDFQIILTAAGPARGDFDVELRYNRCQWTTGDVSNGIPAQAGFDAGNLRDFVALPGSLTSSVVNLCTTSNVSIPGVWRFSVRNGEIDCPGYGMPCESGMPGVCGPGTNVCRSATETVCQPNAMPMDETCNGIDDDCDASTDESQPSLMCGIGACAVVQPSCVGGMVATCVPGLPQPETCNRIDDDCNGTTDDMPDVMCGVGACAATTVACIDGVAQTCVPGMPRVETCNGIDDDCNGAIDDRIDACMFRPDAAVVPDAGLDGAIVRDGATTADASRSDAGACRGWACDPNRLNGRAGPGCDCRIGRSRGHESGAWVIALGLLALIASRRRFIRR